ncbi:FkbM family methyltransferase [Maricaulis sp.]|uniref:FkbM family methyltransferase n=1 Tax=Maricaulis sp. TaxID=1486257 RepID=UPI0026270CF8|nr:FkbM family methyltransferase [Maricaulis sp.]
MARPDPISAPFGAFALPAPAEWLRRLPTSLPLDALRRGAETLVRRALMSSGREIADIEVFPGQFARLHLRDNRCEKRVFAGAKTWDNAERAEIRARLAEHDSEDAFVFVDAGANAGLYTLSVLADAAELAKPVQVLAIEPDPENRRRLEFNLQSSNAEAVTVLPWALGAEEGEVWMSACGKNRGEVHVEARGEGKSVPLRPLAAALAEAGIERVDVMKMDIEGYEPLVLKTFFAESPRTLWPGMILIETRHDAAIEDGAAGLCLQHGYTLARQMRQNAILVLPDGEI